MTRELLEKRIDELQRRKDESYNGDYREELTKLIDLLANIKTALYDY